MKNNSPLLINESPLVIQPTLALLVGLNEAIVLQQIHYWIEHYRQAEKKKSASQQKHFKQGRWWVYNSLTEWRESNFRFWSESTIKRAINSLIKKKLLTSKQFNKSFGDHTNWYSIDYAKLNELFEQHEKSSSSPPPAPDDESKEIETGDPIDQVNLTQSKGSIRPDGSVQDDPLLNRYFNRDYHQRGEEEVNDGCAIGEPPPEPLVIDSDLAEATALLERTGRDLTQDVLARLEQMAERCEETARAKGESGGEWLTQALNLALGKAKPQSILNYADKVLGGWMARGYRVRSRSPSAHDEISPELEIFQQATGRLPLPDQRGIVISLIHQHGFSNDTLRHFWEAWVVRDKRRSDLTWLTDWAVSGEIPPTVRGKRKSKQHPDGISPAVANYVKKKSSGGHQDGHP